MFKPSSQAEKRIPNNNKFLHKIKYLKPRKSREKRMFKEQRAIEELTRALMNDLKPIKDRFEALFTLRSMMTEQACDCLIDSLRLSLLDVESEANYDDTEDVEDEEERSKRKEIRQKTNKKKIDDALFRHEVAFALGQMRCERAIAVLSKVARDKAEHGMTRHECCEALGAIGTKECLIVLREMCEDQTHREVRETAVLALRKVEHEIKRSTGAICGSKKERARIVLNGDDCEKNEDMNHDDADDDDDDDETNVVFSVDPVPAMDDSVGTEQLAKIICDDAENIWERYAAMFALRNRAQKTFGLPKTRERELLVNLCSETLGKALRTGKSALLKHEICYVLGQLRDDYDNESAKTALFACLEDSEEHAMVRHEAAEAIGSRGGEGAEVILKKYSHAECKIVRESCEVALDMLHENNE